MNHEQTPNCTVDEQRSLWRYSAQNVHQSRWGYAIIVQNHLRIFELASMSMFETGHCVCCRYSHGSRSQKTRLRRSLNPLSSYLFSLLTLSSASGRQVALYLS